MTYVVIKVEEHLTEEYCRGKTKGECIEKVKQIWNHLTKYEKMACRIFVADIDIEEYDKYGHIRDIVFEGVQ